MRKFYGLIIFLIILFPSYAKAEQCSQDFLNVNVDKVFLETKDKVFSALSQNLVQAPLLSDESKKKLAKLVIEKELREKINCPPLEKFNERYDDYIQIDYSGFDCSDQSSISQFVENVYSSAKKPEEAIPAPLRQLGMISDENKPKLVKLYIENNIRKKMNCDPVKDTDEKLAKYTVPKTRSCDGIEAKTDLFIEKIPEVGIPQEKLDEAMFGVVSKQVAKRGDANNLSEILKRKWQNREFRERVLYVMTYYDFMRKNDCPQKDDYLSDFFKSLYE